MMTLLRRVSQLRSLMQDWKASVKCQAFVEGDIITWCTCLRVAITHGLCIALHDFYHERFTSVNATRDSDAAEHEDAWTLEFFSRMTRNSLHLFKLAPRSLIEPQPQITLPSETLSMKTGVALFRPLR